MPLSRSWETIRPNQKSNWKMPPCNIPEEIEEQSAPSPPFFSNYCSTESNKMQFKISWISWHDKNKICDFLCVFFANCHKLTLNYLEAIKKCGNNLKSFFPKKKKYFNIVQILIPFNWNFLTRNTFEYSRQKLNFLKR